MTSSTVLILGHDPVARDALSRRLEAGGVAPPGNDTAGFGRALADLDAFVRSLAAPALAGQWWRDDTVAEAFAVVEAVLGGGSAPASIVLDTTPALLPALRAAAAGVAMRPVLALTPPGEAPARWLRYQVAAVESGGADIAVVDIDSGAGEARLLEQLGHGHAGVVSGGAEAPARTDGVDPGSQPTPAVAFHRRLLCAANGGDEAIALESMAADYRRWCDALEPGVEDARIATLEARIAKLERDRHVQARQLHALSGARARSSAQAGARRFHGHEPERYPTGPDGESPPDFPGLEHLLEAASGIPQSAGVCLVVDPPRAGLPPDGASAGLLVLAADLLAHGHRVTLLDVSGFPGAGDTRRELPAGVECVALPSPAVPSARGPMSRVMARARAVHEWLSVQTFDAVVAADADGDLYYCLLAKHLGLAYSDTLLCIRPSGGCLWKILASNSVVTERNDLIRAHAERRSVELADLVLSPSRHILLWFAELGYVLPQGRCVVLPGPLPQAGVGERTAGDGARTPIREVVFFGRLETGQGIKTFCRAIVRLVGRKRLKPDVTFVGSPGESLDHAGFLAEQLDPLGVKWRALTDLDSAGALEYLRGPGRLAVIPPSMANAPRTVLECLALGIPFVASDIGGIPELVEPADHRAALFGAKPTLLAAKLAEVLRDGAITPRASARTMASREAWAGFVASMGVPDSGLRRLAIRPGRGGRESRTPKVSVCMAHFNRPRELSQALESLYAQTYTNFEVILVDDGSHSRDALAYLDRLEPEFAARGWSIVRQENQYLGAVRNTGARHATGEYLMFMDDDNCAKPHEIATFVAAAEHSEADVLTCFADHFRGEDQPAGMPLVCVTPLGDSASCGLFANTYGDSNCLVRRSAFEALGGFTEEFGVGNDDQEFFSRVVLCGYRLMVVPEALYWYRISETRMRSLHLDVHSGKLRVFRPYLDAAPPALADALRLTQGAWIQYEAVRRELDNLADVVAQLRHDRRTLERLKNPDS